MPVENQLKGTSFGLFALITPPADSAWRSFTVKSAALFTQNSNIAVSLRSWRFVRGWGLKRGIFEAWVGIEEGEARAAKIREARPPALLPSTLPTLQISLASSPNPLNPPATQATLLSIVQLQHYRQYCNVHCRILAEYVSKSHQHVH